MKFRELMRKKQSLSHEECEEILCRELRGVLSLVGDGGYPYGVPMNYLYLPETGRIYFHSGKKGHKVDSLLRNDKVSFTVTDGGTKNPGEWNLHIKSVIAFGRIRRVRDVSEIEDICRKLSLKFTDDTDYIDKEIAGYLAGTLCLELIIDHISGKTVNES